MSSDNHLPPSSSTRAERNDSESSIESAVLPVATTVATNADSSIQHTVEPRQPGSLHLTPCTLEQFFELDNGPEDPYELVDGLLVSVPMADDHEHNSIITYLFFLISVLPRDFRPRVVGFANRAYVLGKNDGNHHRNHEASSSKSPPRSSPGSSSSHGSKETCRIPDIFVANKADGSEASGYNSSSPSKERSGHPKERHRTPGWKKAILILEVTSTNRKTDFGPKLREYEKEGIREYVIVDRQKGEKKPKPCVHVYKMSRTTNRYEEKVFRGSEKVDCSFFSHWDLSADDMLDYRVLREIYMKEQKEYEESKERADRAEKERDEERVARKTAADRADRAEKERDEERVARKTAADRADRAEKERDRAKKERDEERAARKTAADRADRAEKERGEDRAARKRLEAEMAQLRKQRSEDEKKSRPEKRKKDLSKDLKLNLNLSPDKKKPPQPGSPSASPESPNSPVSPPHRLRRLTYWDSNKVSGKGKQPKKK